MEGTMTSSRSCHGTALWFCLVLAAASSYASSCSAEVEGPSIVSYAFNGLWTGAEMGLAVGYLATGSTYESHEWRELVLGLGIGALSGMALGISLGIVDASGDPPPIGHYVLRDMGYGVLLGAVAGAAVGALIWVDSGSSKSVLIGTAYGALFGSAAGVIFGLLEGNHAKGRAPGSQPAGEGARVQPTLLVASGSRIPLPGIIGRF
jgi:hypothetical protein